MWLRRRWIVKNKGADLMVFNSQSFVSQSFVAPRAEIAFH
jgi:hypothetical protein